MKLRFLNGHFQGTIKDLNDVRTTIGREVDNDLIIDLKEVSRLHCIIHHDQGKWTIEDNDSSNGVLVNGKKINHTCLLLSGDRISIYSELFLFCGDEQIYDLDKFITNRQHKETSDTKNSASFNWLRIALVAAIVVLAGVLIAIISPTQKSTVISQDENDNNQHQVATPKVNDPFAESATYNENSDPKVITPKIDNEKWVAVDGNNPNIPNVPKPKRGPLKVAEQVLTYNQLNNQINAQGVADVIQIYRGKTIQLTGMPSSSSEMEKEKYFNYGPKIRFFIMKDEFPFRNEQFIKSQKAGRELNWTIQGEVSRVENGRIIIINGQFVQR